MPWKEFFLNEKEQSPGLFRFRCLHDVIEFNGNHVKFNKAIGKIVLIGSFVIGLAPKRCNGGDKGVRLLF